MLRRMGFALPARRSLGKMGTSLAAGETPALLALPRAFHPFHARQPGSLLLHYSVLDEQENPKDDTAGYV